MLGDPRGQLGELASARALSALPRCKMTARAV
jgi:hypothetical protein